QLQQRLHLLLNRLYGRKSERFHPDQPLLFADLNQPAAAPVGATATSPPPAQQKRRHRHGRKPAPKNLPHVEEHHRLTEAERACPTCGRPRVEVGTETTSQLDYQPASVFVRDHIEHSTPVRAAVSKARRSLPPPASPSSPWAKARRAPACLPLSSSPSISTICRSIARRR